LNHFLQEPNKSLQPQFAITIQVIDALALEGAIFASYTFEDAIPYATNKSNHEGAWAQATSF
jgi:hypothetical protein